MLQKLNGFPGHCQILAYNEGLTPILGMLYGRSCSALGYNLGYPVQGSVRSGRARQIAARVPAVSQRALRSAAASPRGYLSAGAACPESCSPALAARCTASPTGRNPPRRVAMLRDKLEAYDDGN